MKFGEMEIDFAVGDPASVQLKVRAMVSNEADLDKLIGALEANRQLLNGKTVAAPNA